MVFGVDDFLAAAIAASTSYLAWSKIDHLMDKVSKTCKPQLRRRFERAAESPSFLMRGFDVTTSVNLPHRGRFNHRRSTSFLLASSQDEMEAILPTFGKSEIQQAFELVGRHGLWEQGVRLTAACIACRIEIRPLFVEATLHALINASEFRRGAAYFCAHATAMPISQSIITALIVGNASFPETCKEMIATGMTGHHKLRPELLSAAVSVMAHDDWSYSIQLYEQMRSSWPDYSTRDTLSSATSCAIGDDERLKWLFGEVESTCPHAAADVHLRMLETPMGTLCYNKFCLQQSVKGTSSATWRTAVDLFDDAPTPANALSCVHILLGQHYNPNELNRIIDSVQLSDVQWGALGAIVGKSDEAVVAASLARQMILKSNVSPALILKPVAQQGMWPVALRLLTLSLTHRRVVPSASEVGLAIHASVALKKWASAAFWVDRSHASLTRLPPSTYDRAFEATRHLPWESTDRIVKSMRDVGDTCTEEGVLSLLSAAATQKRTPDMLRLLTNTNTVKWVQ